jgi:hypothetical protein
MIPRITAQTALPAVRQMVQDLGRLLDEAGNLPAATSFHSSYSGLAQALTHRLVKVGIIAGDEAQAWISRILAKSGLEQNGGVLMLPYGAFTAELEFVALDPTMPPTGRVGQAGPSIVVFDESLDGVGASAEFGENYLAETPIAIVCGQSANLKRWASSGVWNLERIEDDTSAEICSLARLMLTTEEDLLAVLVATSTVNALTSLSRGFVLALEQELRGLRARKALTIQQVSKSQQRPNSTGNDSQGELRQRIQRHQADFDRGVVDRMQSLFAPQTGTLSILVEEKLASLTELEQVAKRRSVGLEIPTSFQQELLDIVRRNLQDHLRSDLVAEKDLFNLVSREIDSHMESKHGPSTVAQFLFFPEDRIQRLMEQCLYVQRRYTGDMAKRGLFDYVMEARRSLMLVTMALSVFGVLTWFRRKPMIMLPLTFLLLVFGGLIAAKNSAREHSDALEKELERARELLRSELRRALSEIQRTWPALVSQHLAEQFQSLLQQVDAAMREHLLIQASDAADEKQRIQRQLQMIENTEKRLMSSMRGRENFDKDISQARGELRQLLSTLLRRTGEVPA